jgi:hypothetical protein
MPEHKCILLVSEPSEQLNHYRHFLEQQGVSHDWIIALSDLKKHLTKTKYQAVMIDLRSRMRSDANDKNWATELESYFMCTSVNWDDQSHKARLASAKWLKMSAEDFVAEAIQAPFRNIRIHERQNYCFNASVKIGEEIFKTNTIDFSLGGCFVWSVQPVNLGDKINLILHDKNEAKIQGSVAWIRPWGQENRPCGFGIIFENRLSHWPET